MKCASIWPAMSACIPSGWSIASSPASSAFELPSRTSAILRRTTAWIDVFVGVAMRLPRRSANVRMLGSLTISQRSASFSGAIIFQSMPRA